MVFELIRYESGGTTAFSESTCYLSGNFKMFCTDASCHVFSFGQQTTYCVYYAASLVSCVSLQRNGGLFGNHVNHVGADQQGYTHPTTVTQRPLQILPFSCSGSIEPIQTGRRTSDDDRGGETEMNSSPIQYNHHYYTPHPYNYPHCISTCHQSPIPSNANLNNANVPSHLSMTNGRQQKCLLRRDCPSSTKTGSSVSNCSKGVHDKPWKSHSTRSVAQDLKLLFALYSYHIAGLTMDSLKKRNGVQNGCSRTRDSDLV